MNFQITRGWSDGALEVKLIPDTAVTLETGNVYALQASGKVVPATYTADGNANDQIPSVCLDVDSTNGTGTGLLNQLIVTTDNFSGVIGDYTVLAEVSALDGQYCPATSSMLVIGRVLAVDSVAGILTITTKVAS